MSSSPLEPVISNNVCQHDNGAFQIFGLQIQFREGEERVSLKFHFRSFLVQSIVLTNKEHERDQGFKRYFTYFSPNTRA